jgi:hypothetical protein
MGAQLPDGLSPLEKALIDTLQNLHADTIRELRIFRWQTLGLIVFLVAIVATLKGVDPTTPAAVVPTVLGGSAP